MTSNEISFPEKIIYMVPNRPLVTVPFNFYDMQQWSIFIIVIILPTSVEKLCWYDLINEWLAQDIMQHSKKLIKKFFFFISNFFFYAKFNQTEHKCIHIIWDLFGT